MRKYTEYYYCDGCGKLLNGRGRNVFLPNRTLNNRHSFSFFHSDEEDAYYDFCDECAEKLEIILDNFCNHRRNR